MAPSSLPSPFLYPFIFCLYIPFACNETIHYLSTTSWSQGAVVWWGWR